MQEFCDDLRRERERLQVSLETVSQVTKFSQRYLLALERGEMASLPGGVFRKGILRGYLSTLDVDPGPWLRRFDECLARLERTAETPDSLAAFAENVRRGRSELTREPTRWPGVLAMVVLLVVFGWCVWRFALRDHVILTHVLRPSPAHGNPLHPPG